MKTLKNELSITDTCIALCILSIMAVVFTVVGGKPLVVTFVVGLAGVSVIVVMMYRRQTEFPDAVQFYPLYFGTLAWQFIHFTEEFWAGFKDAFPVLYGAPPYTTNFFLTINMFSYFIFVVACIGFLTGKVRFLIAPMLFFIVYGGIGNAIAHTWWVISLGEYFPGFYTAQLYWILGPLTLARLVGSYKASIIFTIGFAIVLVPVLTLTIST